MGPLSGLEMDIRPSSIPQRWLCKWMGQTWLRKLKLASSRASNDGHEAVTSMTWSH